MNASSGVSWRAINRKIATRWRVDAGPWSATVRQQESQLVSVFPAVLFTRQPVVSCRQSMIQYHMRYVQYRTEAYVALYVVRQMTSLLITHSTYSSTVVLTTKEQMKKTDMRLLCTVLP